MARVYLTLDMDIGFGMAQIADATYSKYGEKINNALELPSIFWLEKGWEDKYWEKIRNYHKDYRENNLPTLNPKFIKVDAEESLDIIKAYLSILRIKHLFSEIPPFEAFLQNVNAPEPIKNEAKRLYKKLKALLLVPSDVKIQKLAQSELIVIEGNLYGRFGGKWYNIYPDSLPPKTIKLLLNLLKEYKQQKPPQPLPKYLFNKLPPLPDINKAFHHIGPKEIDYSIPKLFTLKYHSTIYSYHAYTPSEMSGIGILYMLKTDTTLKDDEHNTPQENYPSNQEITLETIETHELIETTPPEKHKPLLTELLTLLEETRTPLRIYAPTTIELPANDRKYTLLYDPLKEALYIRLTSQTLIKIPTTNEIALYATGSITTQKLAIIATLELDYKMYAITATTTNELVTPYLIRELNPQEADEKLLEELGTTL